MFCLVGHCLSFRPFSLVPRIVHCSIYGFWLSIWYPQAFLPKHHVRHVHRKFRKLITLLSTYLRYIYCYFCFYIFRHFFFHRLIISWEFDFFAPAINFIWFTLVIVLSQCLVCTLILVFRVSLFLISLLYTVGLSWLIVLVCLCEIKLVRIVS